MKRLKLVSGGDASVSLLQLGWWRVGRGWRKKRVKYMYLFHSGGPLWSMSAEPGCVSRLWPTDITKPLQYEFAISENTG